LQAYQRLPPPAHGGLHRPGEAVALMQTAAGHQELVPGWRNFHYSVISVLWGRNDGTNGVTDEQHNRLPAVMRDHANAVRAELRRSMGTSPLGAGPGDQPLTQQQFFALKGLVDEHALAACVLLLLYSSPQSNALALGRRAPPPRWPSTCGSASFSGCT